MYPSHLNKVPLHWDIVCVATAKLNVICFRNTPERQTNVKLDVNLTGGKDRFPMGIVFSYTGLAGGRISCVYMVYDVYVCYGRYGGVRGTICYIHKERHQRIELYARIIVYGLRVQALKRLCGTIARVYLDINKVKLLGMVSVECTYATPIPHSDHRRTLTICVQLIINYFTLLIRKL